MGISDHETTYTLEGYDLLALDAEFGTLLGEARAELLGPALVLPLLPMQLLRSVQLAQLYS